MKIPLEYLGGASDEAPEWSQRLPLSSPLWGFWWGLLLCLIVFFCGQASKFIYIDF
ncbi:MAG: hypothetical protein ABI883_00535 [Chthoniobacterales bacterium]